MTTKRTMNQSGERWFCKNHGMGGRVGKDWCFGCYKLDENTEMPLPYIGYKNTNDQSSASESKSSLDNWRVRFERELVHKGEDGDDVPEEWVWNMRGSFPIEVEKWIEFELDRTRKEERERLLDVLPDVLPDVIDMEQLYEDITRLIQEE